MRINQVSYRELKSGPGFSHQAVEMTAEVAPGEPVAGALDVLRDRVREELGVQPPPPCGADGDPHTSEVIPGPTPGVRLEQERTAFPSWRRAATRHGPGSTATLWIATEIERLLDFQVTEIANTMKGLRQLARDLRQPIPF